jgi:hypothetical protein
MQQLPATAATTAPSALAAPFIRLWRLDEDERTVGVLIGLFGFLADPIFWGGLGLLAFFGAWDWILGTRIAVWRDEYDGARAYNGILSKLTGLILVFGFRALSGWAALAGIMPAEAVAGVIGSAATAGLILAEIKSIGGKQVELGGGSLTPIVRMFDRLFGIDRTKEDS